MGSVRMPSAMAFTLVLAQTTFCAVNIPRKKENTVATTPVFNDMRRGLKSSPAM